VRQTSVASRVQDAHRFHLAGRLGEAEALYEAALAADPTNANATHALGLLKSQLGDLDAALRLLRQALKSARGNAAVHLNLADVLRRRGEHADALSHYKKALKLNPTYVAAQINLGLLYLDMQRFDDVLAEMDKALKLDTCNVEALHNRGNALRAQKRYGEAIESYSRAIELQPTNQDAYYNLGLALGDIGQFQDALACFEAALALKPQWAAVHSSRGNALRSLGRSEEALVAIERALALDPASVSAHVNRGHTLKELNRTEAALAAYERAISLDPAAAKAHNSRGDLLNQLGRFGEAERSFETAIALDPAAAGHYVNLALARRFKVDDPMIGQIEALLADTERLGTEDRAKLHYTLGKAYGDIGEATRGFQHHLAGARLKRSVITYDEAATMQLFDAIETVFTAERIASLAGMGDASARPIFILGMPRSGTSLVEQILASHPHVHGAGELAALNRALNPIELAHWTTYPDVVERFGASDLMAIAADYLSAIRRIDANAAHVTDKMPANFLLLGLIHLAFPNATIIHTVRDPIDTCVSCFSILFSEPQDYSYDLAELGRYYRRYARLMAHWRAVLPPGRFINVAYEHVVADLETEARRIVAHCGLPWDDACLAFHQAKRVVKTASVAQVRQPIYTGSVGRWKAIEAELGPLMEALGEG
jgi:tetratricopeptide (TPR) repeat protein